MPTQGCRHGTRSPFPSRIEFRVRPCSKTKYRKIFFTAYSNGRRPVDNVNVRGRKPRHTLSFTRLRSIEMLIAKNYWITFMKRTTGLTNGQLGQLFAPLGVDRHRTESRQPSGSFSTITRS